MYTCPVLPIFVLWNWVNHNNYSWVPLSIVSLYRLIIFVKLLVFPFYRQEILTSEKVIWGHTASVGVGELDFEPCFWRQSTSPSGLETLTSESPGVFENQKFLGLCLSKSTSWGVRRIDNYFLNKHPRRFFCALKLDYSCTKLSCCFLFSETEISALLNFVYYIYIVLGLIEIDFHNQNFWALYL